MKLRRWPAPPVAALVLPVAALVLALAASSSSAQPRRPGPKPPACPAGQKLCRDRCVPADVAHGCGGGGCEACGPVQSHVEKSVCVRADATTTRCGYTACQPAWIDEDGDPTNGCEIQRLAAVEIDISAPYQVTRHRAPGASAVLYHVWQLGPASLTAVTMTSEARDVRRDSGVWLIVPVDQDDDLRLCLDRPFRRLELTVAPGEHGLRAGVQAPFAGLSVGGVAVDRAAVTCLRTFEPPPPAF